MKSKVNELKNKYPNEKTLSTSIYGMSEILIDYNKLLKMYS